MEKIKKPPAFQKRLSVSNSQKLIPISLKSAESVVRFLLDKSGFKAMNVHFVGKKKISALHQDFFDDPSPTDCITFPYEDPHFLGEVFVCPLVAKEYVEKHGGNLYEEITLYVIHGFCHLLGFDDTSAALVEAMRKEEKKWMSALAKNHIRITG